MKYAVQVVLGYPYDVAVDMWSLGCMAAELFLGLPLFPGASEHDLLVRIVEMLGAPPDWLLHKAQNTAKFFRSLGPGPAEDQGAFDGDLGSPQFVVRTQAEFEAMHGQQAPAGKLQPYALWHFVAQAIRRRLLGWVLAPFGPPPLPHLTWPAIPLFCMHDRAISLHSPIEKFPRPGHVEQCALQPFCCFGGSHLLKAALQSIRFLCPIPVMQMHFQQQSDGTTDVLRLAS